MKCPRCERATLLEVDRDGVTIDRCDSCRGIWLDRGELEKLMSRASTEDDRRRSRRDDDDDDDDDARRRGGRSRWWDIFD